VWVGAVGDEAGKLAVESNGDVLIAHEDLAMEVDWLVGGRVGLLPTELFYQREELRCIVLVRAGFCSLDPCLLVCFVDVLLNLLVEEGEPGVGGRVSANAVALADEALGGV